MSDERREIIYQANPLIEARKPFDVIEMRLFLLALQHVNPHLSASDRYYDKSFKELHLLPSQVKEIFGHGEYLRRLKKICEGMMNRVVTIDNGESGFDMYAIFGRIRYEPKNGLFIKFNDDMRPLILDIFESGKGFTKIAAKQMFCLGSTYAVRLIELMLQYKGTTKGNEITRHIELEQLRFFMDIQEGQYKQIGSFTQMVIDKPIKEINDSTQYKMSYVKTKTGRRVTGFDFTLDCSAVMSESEAPEIVKLEAPPKKNERYGLSAQAINNLTTICGSNEEFRKRMDHALKLAEKRNPENLQGFLYNAIKDNYRQQDIDAQAAIEREIQAVMENNEWEEVASKMFSNEIKVRKERPEIPFDLTDSMDVAIVRVIKSALKEKRLDFTVRSRLEEHNMSIPRFLELYGTKPGEI